MKRYRIGVSILNCYEVEAKNQEEAEDMVRNYSDEELLRDSDFSINYIDEASDEEINVGHPLCDLDTYDEHGVNTKNSFNTQTFDK
tara:strand:- start:695 stop:952 length:258 start_codon:yes stop_codon:yes gene_type:complete